MPKNNQNKLFKLVLTAMLIALNVIMERFLSFNVWNLSVGFSFITIGFAASFLGVPYAITVAGLGDIIGAIFFPFGTYFPGFTLTNVLAGFIVGMPLRKNATKLKIILAVIIDKLITTLLLNTFWITLLYRNSLDAFPAVLVTRIPQAAAMTVIESAVFIILFSKKSKIKLSLSKKLYSVMK